MDRDTLKTRAGLALIVGHAWVLPPFLLGEYPAGDDLADVLATLEAVARARCDGRVWRNL